MYKLPDWTKKLRLYFNFFQTTQKIETFSRTENKYKIANSTVHSTGIKFLNYIQLKVQKGRNKCNRALYDWQRKNNCTSMKEL